MATMTEGDRRGPRKSAWRQRFRFLRALVYVGLLLGFLYQASDVVVNYLTFPTANDVRVEGPEQLLMPAASACISNWISQEKLCARQAEFCNYSDTEEYKQRLLRFLDTAGNLGELAMDSEVILQVVMENPGMSIFPSGFAKQHLVQSFSRLPYYMCFTFDWRGSNSLVNFKEDPLTYEMSMIVLWYPDRSPRLSQYEMDMTFHHVDSISAATKHTLLLRPSGSYEYSLQQVMPPGGACNKRCQRMLKRLEFPYDTNCVDYGKLEKLAHYPAYHTQETCFADCVRNETRRHCGCTLTDYPFRAFLNETFCAGRRSHGG
ncbi:uncharacterized protein LOC125944441 [Dermacentor silvarum]|uniref:uncharacterized protein LOC125944441 n=1 Tax=Dermacentor silvarum TaxID=543639 RepID=UPI002100BB83|nr:uncharacterized protein LOC125944441 [Dermacentor silvarum]